MYLLSSLWRQDCSLVSFFREYSLLFTVGVLGSMGRVNLALLIPFSILGALLGDQLGYAIGRQSGEALAYRYAFVRDNVQRASQFYSTYGGKAIVLARFVPVVRTFAPLVAGAAGMSYSRFTICNFAGGALWVLSVMLAGYFVGSLAPAVTGYLNPLILVVILTSPIVWMIAWVGGEPRRDLKEGKTPCLTLFHDRMFIRNGACAEKCLL